LKEEEEETLFIYLFICREWLCEEEEGGASRSKIG